MITYEIKLEKIGEMTTLPDSQRLFGFLINYSKRYCSEDEISHFVKGVREHEQKCMISSMVPTGYYPTPKEYIMQKLQRRLGKNREEIEKLEKKQIDLKKESESIIEGLIEKNSQKKKEINELKSQIKQIENKFKEVAVCINNLSTKNIYATIKSMDFIDKDELKNLFELIKKERIVNVEDLAKFEHIKKTKTFIQKFRLEDQINELPGMPNVAYSLPILSFVNKAEEIQKDFSFFVRVEKDSCLSKCLEKMKNSLNESEIPCFLGGKASSGYNEYRIYKIEEFNDSEDREQPSASVRYLNMGALLPNFDNIDVKNSVLDIYTSDRKPFEIENEISKVISFITAGSVIKLRENIMDPHKIGKSIDNSKYNPMYKDTIIFGNSYFVKLEVHDET